ncbi:MAG: hypothetical protein SGARI_007035 [Bacillariaceae sp.]
MTILSNFGFWLTSPFLLSALLAPTATTKQQSTIRTMSSSNNNTPRYNGPPVEEMTDAQIKIRDFIVQSRPRTGFFKESELVILLTGAKHRSKTEFEIHTGEAIKAGMTMEQIQAIPQGDAFSVQQVDKRVVPLLETEREKTIARFTAELLDTCTVSEETYNNTKTVLDGKDSVLVEITSITGYYTYVSYTLNVFNIPAK